MKWTTIFVLSVLLAGCAASTDVTLLGSLQGDGQDNPVGTTGTETAEGTPVAVPARVLTDEELQAQTRQELQALAASPTAPASANSSASLQELLDLRDGHASAMSDGIEKAAAECEELDAAGNRPAGCN